MPRSDSPEPVDRLEVGTASRGAAAVVMLVAALALIAVLAWLRSASTAAAGSRTDPAAASPESKRAAPSQPAPRAGDREANRAVDGAPDAVGEEPGKLKMPDGTFVEPLNGVEDPRPAIWRRPYSPITGKERRSWPGYGEIEWYVHADGTRTTTIIGDGLRDGKPSREPLTLVEHPLPAADAEDGPAGSAEAASEPDGGRKKI